MSCRKSFQFHSSMIFPYFPILTPSKTSFFTGFDGGFKPVRFSSILHFEDGQNTKNLVGAPGCSHGGDRAQNEPQLFRPLALPGRSMAASYQGCGMAGVEVEGRRGYARNDNYGGLKLENDDNFVGMGFLGIRKWSRLPSTHGHLPTKTGVLPGQVEIRPRKIGDLSNKTWELTRKKSIRIQDPIISVLDAKDQRNGFWM